ncbi:MULTISPECIES: hypothetical protein [Pseudomonas]|uniref:hypothetical protein n=1 Tax=Pseudomonas TaxID=286 RepID=UPI001C300836|nr:MULTISPECIES: hypothetical protein [Pseudomonas]MBV2082340.1 hypothetical protein [Pseudomonas carnis]MBV2086216.1 hypothetical protein [Pseudomonas carnis]MDO3689797.1 hypothetical protein [Pseudomonas sp. DKN 2791]MDO7033769.1 hypothetical protein [Pseudomonas sp. DKN 2792]
MSTEFYFWKEDEKNLNSENTFTWTLDGGDKTLAETVVFVHNKEKTLWLFKGSIGTWKEANVFGFSFSLPYEEGDITETYNLTNEFQGYQSIRHPTLPIDGVRSCIAQEAEVNISINTHTGKAEGSFSATFAGTCTDMNVNGTFTMINPDNLSHCT